MYVHTYIVAIEVLQHHTRANTKPRRWCSDFRPGSLNNLELPSLDAGTQISGLNEHLFRDLPLYQIYLYSSSRLGTPARSVTTFNETLLPACIDNILDIPSYFCPGGASYGFEKSWNSEKKCHIIQSYGISPAGGTAAERAEFPFMALLGFGASAEEAQWLCGGSVLSARYILTAAHCISEPRLGPLKYAALGILKRSDPPEIWQRHTLAQVIPHPDYASPSKYHDIALLKTEKQIQFNINVVPACLYSGEKKRNIDPSRALALGWGYLGPNTRLADVLQKVEVSEFTAEECLTHYPPHRHLLDGFDNSTQLCYGDRNKTRDTCEGDSGGPLILHNSEVGCAKAVFGVTSSGVECDVATAGLYTRVEHYKPWIESIVWP
ncbi:serine protease Hayan-like [Bombyx mandarina]|uniref:Serine protease Hayan-like n=1 Tax=Bombyx mandarina TaxID=7092 RepID=A0A6J2JBX0_BOMMA|nr:serine protease Hayan-like [Bombyx mandarina]